MERILDLDTGLLSFFKRKTQLILEQNLLQQINQRPGEEDGARKTEAKRTDRRRMLQADWRAPTSVLDGSRENGTS